ncbi:MAG: phosphoribosylanthranilate isomerase [Candidatus Hydrothermarchaeota archaeon]
MIVKICGITNEEDAVLAEELGGDIIGFIAHAKSKRLIDIEKIGEITDVLSSKTALVMENPNEEILDKAANINADFIQLHGNESPELCHKLKEMGFETIKTVHVPVKATDINGMLIYCSLYECSFLLLDTKIGRISGGTGIRHDWNLSKKIIEEVKKPVFLSGGLNPENVKKAIQITKPYGVDVSSGVESEIGRKDPNLLYEFIKNSKEGFYGIKS